jgi:hypothetical protein
MDADSAFDKVVQVLAVDSSIRQFVIYGRMFIFILHSGLSPATSALLISQKFYHIKSKNDKQLYLSDML